jgi:hypothetical protein
LRHARPLGAREVPVLRHIAPPGVIMRSCH